MKIIIENLLNLQTFELSGTTGAATEKRRAELRAKAVEGPMLRQPHLLPAGWAASSILLPETGLTRMVFHTIRALLILPQR